MPYSSEVYTAANLVLEERRRNAEHEANLIKSDAYAKIPEVEEIDQNLARGFSSLSMLVMNGTASFDSALVKMQEECKNMQAKKAKLLVENGFSADCLEPHYTCKDCCDTGRVGGVLCSCYKELCRQKALEELDRSSGSANCSFENFRTDFYPDNGVADGTNPRRKMSNIFEFCKLYADGFSENSESLVLIGKTGLGKTHLSLSIAREAVKKGFGVVYTPAQRLVSSLELEHFSGSGSSTMKKKYSSCDLLIIDDLGAEFPTQFTTAAIGNLINERLFEKRPTIISTNLMGNELTARYTERTASRILGEYRKLYFLGEDIRFLKNY